MDVYIAFAASRRSTSAGSTAFDKKRPRDGGASFVISFGSGVVCGREQGYGLLAIRTFSIIHRKKAVIGRNEHRCNAHVIETAESADPLRDRFAGAQQP